MLQNHYIDFKILFLYNTYNVFLLYSQYKYINLNVSIWTIN